MCICVWACLALGLAGSGEEVEREPADVWEKFPPPLKKKSFSSG